MRGDGDNIPEIEEITEEVAECPVCGAIIPADAKVCPECGAVFEEEEEEGGVELEEEEETEEEFGEEEGEYGEEEENEGEVKPAKADKRMFWAGLITLLIGSQGIALGSLVHNTLKIGTHDSGWGNPSYKVYGYLDQIVGIVGIIITLIGIFLLIMYMKKQSEEEKYREQLKEEAENDPEVIIPDEFQEPLLVQNKMFFWIGFTLMLITGPLAVIAGFLGQGSVDTIGAYVGGGGGGTLTVLGIILLFLSIWQRKTGEETEEGEEEETEGLEEEYEEGEEFEEEPEEELEDLEEEEEIEE